MAHHNNKPAARKGARLGQHFLKSRAVARAVALATKPVPGETILEIGPGKGALTRELLATGCRVIAIEKDELLVSTLHETFQAEIDSGTLTIVSEDVRNVSLESLGLEAGKYVLAANIPYYITGEIIRQFLTTDIQPRAMALLIQKEVAQRITSKTESILSLSVKAYGTPRIIAKVPAKDFSPPPSVDSAVLCIENISRSFFDTINEEQFFTVIKAGFAAKRKQLGGNLATVFGKELALAALEKSGIPSTTRAENVPLEKWKDLSENLNV
jgi:16S rRNA (adenine1518-N6/adenine1519-N6)-dimethyltransferase